MSHIIMAYIGDNSPHRGDSKAAMHLSKLIAEMLDGRYVYVDQAMLERSFPTIDNLKDRMRAFYIREGYPDIIIGPHKPYLLEDRPVPMVITGVNECISQWSKSYDVYGLVSHHLTEEDIQRETSLFRQHYPDIKGPLTGVFLAGHTANSDEINQYAEKLIRIGRQYPEMTFFVCSSHRSGNTYEAMKVALERQIKSSTRIYEGIMDIFSYASTLWGNRQPRKETIRVMGASEEEIACGYNPYIGLLGAADHLVVSGDSLSTVSEALFTGKNIYIIEKRLSSYTKLRSEGYIQDLLRLNSKQKFPTQNVAPLDVTRETAQSIADEYRRWSKTEQTPVSTWFWVP